jgi:hypothetical protein
VLKRWCWNWQTGMVEGHVPKGVEVQVLSSAPSTSKKSPSLLGIFIFLVEILKVCLLLESVS